MKKGFTLIELLVVVTLIGVLLTIAIPKFFGIAEGSQKSAFGDSVKLMINAASKYMIDEDCPLSLPVTNGKGVVVTIDALATSNLIKKEENLDNSVVVVYNNNGTYEYYAFATNGKFYVDGYKSALVDDHIETVGTAIDYITETTGVTDYTLTSGQLSY